MHFSIHSREKESLLRWKRERQFLRLEVYNDGETIPEERMDHIWDSFYTSSRKKKAIGTGCRNIGLGLFVVRKIMENHEAVVAWKIKNAELHSGWNFQKGKNRS